MSIVAAGFPKRDDGFWRMQTFHPAIVNDRVWVGIDRETHEVIVAGAQIELTPREFDLLWTLADRPGRVVTHESLLGTVWGPAHRQDLNYLRVAVRALRHKIEYDPASPKLIVNEPGVGYRIAAPG